MPSSDSHAPDPRPAQPEESFATEVQGRAALRDPASHLASADACLAAGEVELALAEWTRALRLSEAASDTAAAAAESISRVLLARGHTAAARSFQEHARTRNPGHPSPPADRAKSTPPTLERGPDPPMLRPGARTTAALEACADELDFHDKHVIELGGALPRPTIDALGVRSWTSLDPNSPERIEPGHRVLPLRSHAVALPDARADLVFACDGLRKLPDPSFALAEAARLLRPGGRLFGTLAPLWSGPFGFEDGTDWGDPMPVLPAWSHLLFEPRDLVSWLTPTEGPERARALAHGFFATPPTQRFFEEAFTELLHAGTLVVERLEPLGRECPPGPRLAARLRASAPGHTRFSANGLRFLLRKPVA